MFVIPDDLPIEVTPFAFLLGSWDGTGIISYKADGDENPATEHEFHQHIEFAHDGLDTVSYISTAKLSDGTVLPSELGFWKLTRGAQDADAGPGLLPGTGARGIQVREDLESLRNQEGGFDIQVSMLHPGGVAELYHGKIKGARIDLASFAGTAFDGAKTYRHSTRIYGLVEHALLWAWDIALPGSELKSHASARLEKVEK